MSESIGPAPCRVIAEAGSNHDGDFDEARRLIDVAASAGADAVKFQLFRARSLYPPNAGTMPGSGGPLDILDTFQALEMPVEWLAPLKSYAETAGIDFLCTPFDAEMVDRCAEAGLGEIKVASPELTHLPLLRHIARTARKVLLSTGMSTLGDIEEALMVLRTEGDCEVTLLHCVTAYPCPEEDANVAAMRSLRSAFDTPVGLSDHTMDPVGAPVTAVALGASVVEKHFTRSRARAGPDHPFAVEPDELALLVKRVREVERHDSHDRVRAAEEILGDQRFALLAGAPTKQITVSEQALASCDRRALHAVIDIAAGATIDDRSIAVLRGERNLRPGLHPRFLEQVIGARAVRTIKAGDGVVWDDVINRDSS